MKSIGLLLILSLTCALGALQVARSPGLQSASVSSQGSAKLEGTVLDALSGRPIEGAEVRLATGRTAFPEDNDPPGMTRPTAIPKPPYSAKTDSSGRFSIPGIRPGSYVVGVAAKGYSHYDVGRTSTNTFADVAMVISPDFAKPLNVRLTPGATLSGTIMNGEREALKGVPVYLLKRASDTFHGGTTFFVQMMTALTSESGGYEFADVPWGTYFIFAGRGASIIPTVRSQPLYGWNFYPGSSDPSRATQIDASPGANLGGLDLLVKEQSPRRIRGMVIDSRTGKPPENASVFLFIPSPFQGYGGGDLKYDAANGRFEATELIDGTYAIGVKLKDSVPATRGGMETFARDAWEQFEISGTDRDDILIQVPRSGYIRGRIILEGKLSLAEAYPPKTPSTPVVANSGFTVPPGLPGLSGPGVALTQTSTLQPGASNPVAANLTDGAFEVPNLLSGRYRLAVVNLPAGYYLKDVRQNGATASDVFMDFRPDRKDQLDITITPGAGEVTGVVVNEGREPLGGSIGSLLPDPLPYEIGSYYPFIADKNGQFKVSNVPPGKYRIYVFDGLPLGELPDLDMYRRSAALATPLLVTEGSQLSITARAINSK
jgi:hypothetical protein